LDFYLKIIFVFLFISSFLISQSQIGSNISNKSETISMSADGKITAVSDGTSSKIYSWNGTNDQGEIVSGGVYIFKISAGTYFQTKKMIFIK